MPSLGVSSNKADVTGNTFTGNALAKLGPFSAPATLNGTLLTVNQAAAQGL
jgi:hypothetical protein